METVATGIHGHTLEVTVLSGCKFTNLKKFRRQRLYVRMEYGSNKYQTRTRKGGKKPTFDEMLTITLIEGLLELHFNVWNNHRILSDDFIGSGSVKLNKVLSRGYEQLVVTLQDTSHKYAGEIRLILHAPHVLEKVVNGSGGFTATPHPQYNRPPPSIHTPYVSPTTYAPHSQAHVLHRPHRHQYVGIYPQVESSHQADYHKQYPINYPPFMQSPYSCHSEASGHYPRHG